MHKAFEYFLKSAQQENPQEQLGLGYMYLNGYGVKKDSNIAFDWLSKAAKQGNEDAKKFLMDIRR